MENSTNNKHLSERRVKAVDKLLKEVDVIDVRNILMDYRTNYISDLAYISDNHYGINSIETTRDVLRKLPIEVIDIISLICISKTKFEVNTFDKQWDGIPFTLSKMNGIKGYALDIELTDRVGKSIVSFLLKKSGRYIKVIEATDKWDRTDIYAISNRNICYRNEVKVRTSLGRSFMCNVNKFNSNDFFIFVCLIDFKIYTYSKRDADEGWNVTTSFVKDGNYYDAPVDTVDFYTNRCANIISIYDVVHSMIVNKELLSGE